MSKNKNKKPSFDLAKEKAKLATPPRPEQLAPDYTKKCIVCGATPIMPLTEMCGPCTFGDSDTIDGNW